MPGCCAGRWPISRSSVCATSRFPAVRDPHGARAILEPTVALPLYRRKLSELQADFRAASEALESAKDSRQRYDLLGRQLVTLRLIVDHGLVAVALGEAVSDPPANESALMAQRDRLEQGVDSLTLAARLLLKDVDGSLTDVLPIMAWGSNEVTDLSYALTKVLMAAGAGRGGAALTAKGDYRILENGEITVSIELRQQSRPKLLGVRTVRLLPLAFSG